jgi:hypothetical protein
MKRIDLIIDALLVAESSVWSEKIVEALAAACELKELQPVVKVIAEDGGVCFELLDKKLPVGTKLYAAPPRKEWVGLTDDEVDACFADHGWSSSAMYHLVANALEFKLKEKNT